jgi:hypothetical protein
MKSDIAVASSFAVLLGLFSSLGCENPTDSESRRLYLTIKGDRPFFAEGTMDSLRERTRIDSSHYLRWTGLIEWQTYDEANKGAYFRVKATSQASDGYIFVEVRMLTGYIEFHDAKEWFYEKRESREGSVEISCNVP